MNLHVADVQACHHPPGFQSSNPQSLVLGVAISIIPLVPQDLSDNLIHLLSECLHNILAPFDLLPDYDCKVTWAVVDAYSCLVTNFAVIVAADIDDSD